MKLPQLLTIDQALLWIGTLNVQTVVRAAPWGGPERLSWIGYRMAASQDEEDVLQRDASEVEQILFSLLTTGDVAAIANDEIICPSWFVGAELINVGSATAAALHVDGNPMVFKKLEASSSNGQIASTPISYLAPLIDTSSLVCAISKLEAVVVRAIEGERGEVNQPPVSKRGGRQPIYDWREFLEEARTKLEYEGGLGATTGFLQSDLERHMAGWCERSWERQPSESMIRGYVVKARNAHRAEKADNS